MGILKKEDIIIENQETLEINDEKEEQIYPMNGIKVDKGFFSVYELKRRYDAAEKRIILDSDFQRENVWGIDRKAELVESVLMGLPLPIFYFNQDKYGKLIVVDGRQRLTAMFEYMDDAYALNKLRILPGLNGLRFSELNTVLASRLEDYQIQAHVILPPTPDRVKFDIFDRVNRGGVQLNKQEIRNALYQGKATKFLNSIVKGMSFRRATGEAFLNEKRMKDKYLINRFVALYMYNDMPGYLFDDEKKPYVYRDDVDDFLGRVLDCINGMDDQSIIALEEKVNKALDNCVFYLGGDAFRLKREGKKTPINMNVFETIMMAMCDLDSQRDEIRETVSQRVFRLIDSAEFAENISSHRDGASRLLWRVEQAERMRENLERIIKV